MKKLIAKLLYMVLICAIVLLGFWFFFAEKDSDTQAQVPAFFPNFSYTEKYQDEKTVVEAVELVRVVDGDTLIVNTPSEKNVRVRLIGVDTPESVNPDETKNTPEGKIASDFTKSFLKTGKTYYLEYGKDREDDYGRTLAYLWLTDCSDAAITEQYIKENMFNAILLDKGFAKTMRIEPNTKYANDFEKIEQK